MPVLKKGELVQFIDFVKSYAPGHYADEIAAELKNRYGLEVNDTQVRSFLSNQRISTVMQGKMRRDRAPQTVFTSEMVEFMKAHQYDYDNDQMYEVLVKKYPSVAITRKMIVSFRRKHKITFRVLTPEEMEFCRQNKKLPRQKLCKLLEENFGKKISRERLNAILSYYKVTYDNRKNNSKRLTKHKVGDKRLRHGHKGKVVYTEIMIENGKWMPYHRYLYEQHHKVKLGRDMNVIFIDGDRTNFDIDNLFAVPVNLMAIMSYKGIWTSERNKENIDIGITLAKMNIRLNELKKKQKELKKNGTKRQGNDDCKNGNHEGKNRES